MNVDREQARSDRGKQSYVVCARNGGNKGVAIPLCNVSTGGAAVRHVVGGKRKAQMRPGISCQSKNAHDIMRNKAKIRFLE